MWEQSLIVRLTLIGRDAGATEVKVSTRCRRRLRGSWYAAVIVGHAITAPSGGVAQTGVEDTGVLSLRPLVGWGENFNFGVDVGLTIASDLEVLGSAHHWSAEEILCALACQVQTEGWSFGGGLRFTRGRATRRSWPFLHVEAGTHRFLRWESSFAGPRQKPFVGARGGVAARWSGLDVELGVRVQRVPGFDYETEGAGRTYRLHWGPKWYWGLQAGLGLVIL